MIAFQGRDWTDSSELRQAWQYLADKNYGAAKGEVARSSWAKKHSVKANDLEHVLDVLDRNKVKNYYKAVDIQNSLRANDQSWDYTPYQRAITKGDYQGAASLLDSYNITQIPASTLRGFQQTLRYFTP